MLTPACYQGPDLHVSVIKEKVRSSNGSSNLRLEVECRERNDHCLSVIKQGQWHSPAVVSVSDVDAGVDAGEEMR